MSLHGSPHLNDHQAHNLTSPLKKNSLFLLTWGATPRVDCCVFMFTCPCSPRSTWHKQFHVVRRRTNMVQGWDGAASKSSKSSMKRWRWVTSKDGSLPGGPRSCRTNSNMGPRPPRSTTLGGGFKANEVQFAGRLSNATRCMF